MLGRKALFTANDAARRAVGRFIFDARQQNKIMREWNARATHSWPLAEHSTLDAFICTGLMPISRLQLSCILFSAYHASQIYDAFTRPEHGRCHSLPGPCAKYRLALALISAGNNAYFCRLSKAMMRLFVKFIFHRAAGFYVRISMTPS